MTVDEHGLGTLSDQVRIFFNGVAEEDLTELAPVGLATIVDSQALLASSPSARRIRVSPHHDTRTSLLQIVTADAPFLVDSVVNVLEAHGLTIGPVVHPIMGGVRGRESWIFVQLGGLVDEQRAEDLVEALASVIADVHTVADAGAALLARVERAAALAAGSDESVRRFLLWMASGRFDVYGHRLADSDADALGITAGALGNEAAEGIEVTTTRVWTSVRRRALLDRVIVRLVQEDGTLLTQCFDGLFTTLASRDPLESVPIAGTKAQALVSAISPSPNSHASRVVNDILEGLPLPEVLSAPVSHLLRIVTDVRRLTERRAARAFMRIDAQESSTHALVFLPRDWYSTDVRIAIQGAIRRALGGGDLDFTVRLGNRSLAQVSFTVTRESHADISPDSLTRLERVIEDLCTPWRSRLQSRLRVDGRPSPLATMFPDDYVALHEVDEAVADARRIASVPKAKRFSVLSVGPALPDGSRDLRLFSRDELALADLLQTVQSLGLVALDERSWLLEREESGSHLVRLRVRAAHDWRPTSDEPVIQAVEQIAGGAVDADALNRLVITVELTWQEVEVLRTYVRYLRQLKPTFTHAYISEVLNQSPHLSRMFIGMFSVKFRPGGSESLEARERAFDHTRGRYLAGLEEVRTADADRIHRDLLTLLEATVRTNAYYASGDLDTRPALSIKLQTSRIPFAPAPRPSAEVWVHSSTVEGVHLRFAAVARGGVRWSDRCEDFRTEILGLAKAQTVKNAVIVPGGAKGGFVLKADRSRYSDEEWSVLGRTAYRVFVGALLDVTDNVRRDETGETVVRRAEIVAHDGDDPYLVVAADKGTAHLSDVANELSVTRDFWLGDAFASGGSNGYDHKALGITARGAWESVRRHFEEFGVDPDRDPITAVGIGDMSGDVFGNGMLLSRSMRLIAAFDHRHIFVDPSPDAGIAHAERTRLFQLPRSSWADYDPSLISPGGGVFERTAKVVPVGPEMREALGLSVQVHSLSPSALISAVLSAPVDLLWNGGVGTYVKASIEVHADAADRANDAVRVNASDLRARVVGEGGNLGFTQAARVEAAFVGVHLNTDAIDNSAGVDCSDHEVNLKIALDDAVAAGELRSERRGEVLRSMAEEVSALVIRDNYEQNVLLANERAKAAEMLPVHQRFIQWLERERSLDRALEGLPSDEELIERRDAGRGLVSPELAVLAALAKLAVKKDLERANLQDEPFGMSVLNRYFPERVKEVRGERLVSHRLAASIVATTLANDVINIGGVTFMLRAQEESGATADQVVRAFAVAREVFDIDTLRAEIRAAGTRTPAALQAQMHSEIRRLMDRATRWLLQRAAGVLDVDRVVRALSPRTAPFLGDMPDRLFGDERTAVAHDMQKLVRAGVDRSLAARMATLLYEFRLLDVSAVASEGFAMDDALEAYLAVSERYGVSKVLQQIAALPRDGRWHPLARTSLRADLEQVVSAVATRVLNTAGDDVHASIDSWERGVERPISRARDALREVERMPRSDFAAVSVAIRLLREATQLNAAAVR